MKKVFWFLALALVITLIAVMADSQASPADGFKYWGALCVIWYNITLLSYQYVKLFNDLKH